MCMCKPVSRKPKLSFSLVICFNCWGFKRLQSFSFYLCLVPLFKHILTAILYLNIFFPFYIKLICLVLFCRIWIRDTDMWKTSEQKTTTVFVICFTCWGNKDFSNFLFMLRVLFNCLNTFFLQCYIWILYFIFTCNLTCIFFYRTEWRSKSYWCIWICEELSPTLHHEFPTRPLLVNVGDDLMIDWKSVKF